MRRATRAPAGHLLSPAPPWATTGPWPRAEVAQQLLSPSPATPGTWVPKSPRSRTRSPQTVSFCREKGLGSPAGSEGLSGRLGPGVRSQLRAAAPPTTSARRPLFDPITRTGLIKSCRKLQLKATSTRQNREACSRGSPSRANNRSVYFSGRFSPFWLLPTSPGRTLPHGTAAPACPRCFLPGEAAFGAVPCLLPAFFFFSSPLAQS